MKVSESSLLFRVAVVVVPSAIAGLIFLLFTIAMALDALATAFDRFVPAARM